MNMGKRYCFVLGAVLLAFCLFTAQSASARDLLEGKDNAVYQKEVAPLTTLECAQCHYTVFDNIRKEGGKHQLECRFCHQTFHALRPGIPWNDVVPHCTTCHGETHGPAFVECLACHQDPHTPITSLSNLESLSTGCKNCHTAQNTEVTQNPSAHTQVACADCHHTQHGYKPGCLECHPEPHTAYTDNQGCQGCHPVHSPLHIAYEESVSNDICAVCHEQVTKDLVTSPSKHYSLQCASCHADNHGFIPECQRCHGLPHSKSVLDKFEGCLDCHDDPHTLGFSSEGGGVQPGFNVEPNP